MARLSVIVHRLGWAHARRKIHDLVDQAIALGVANRRQLDFLVSTAAAQTQKRVWLPDQVRPLIDAGLLVDTGPARHPTSGREYAVKKR